MSDEKKYTERELVLAQREAFLEGFNANINSATVEERYPLPKVTRPRVVRDKYGDAWTVRDGQLLCNRQPISWASEETFKALADLLANPTETVDADD